MSEKDLIPLNERTKDEQKEIQSKGGKASGKARREKKLMSQILADYLQKEHEVTLKDSEGNIIDNEKIPASQLIERTVSAILARGDSASATMIKTMGELTEGNKLRIGGLNSDAIPFEFVDPPNASTE
jgi:hypothetical protein